MGLCGPQFPSGVSVAVISHPVLPELGFKTQVWFGIVLTSSRQRDLLPWPRAVALGHTQEDYEEVGDGAQSKARVSKRKPDLQHGPRQAPSLQSQSWARGSPVKMPRSRHWEGAPDLEHPGEARRDREFFSA